MGGDWWSCGVVCTRIWFLSCLFSLFVDFRRGLAWLGCCEVSVWRVMDVCHYLMMYSDVCVAMWCMLCMFCTVTVIRFRHIYDLWSKSINLMLVLWVQRRSRVSEFRNLWYVLELIFSHSQWCRNYSSSESYWRSRQRYAIMIVLSKQHHIILHSILC